MTGVMVLLVKSEVSGSVFRVINFILLMAMCLFFKVLSFQKLSVGTKEHALKKYGYGTHGTHANETLIIRDIVTSGYRRSKEV